jgi:hypothetical protein
MTIPEVAAKLSTRLNNDQPNSSLGLCASDIEGLQARYGKNVLTPPKLRPLWLQFLLKVRS